MGSIEVDPELVEMFQSQILEWGEDNIRDFPWRDPNASLYDVFIAEFFLARTRSNVVDRVYPDFVAQFPDLDTLRNAQREDIVDVIRPMGLQNRRADAIREIIEQLDDDLPQDAEGLLELPRVGPYVANATICFARGEHAPILDTNVNRVHQRFFGDAWPPDKDDKWDFLEVTLPKSRPRKFNLAILDFGSLVCSAQSPDCENCPLADSCSYFESISN